MAESLRTFPVPGNSSTNSILPGYVLAGSFLYVVLDLLFQTRSLSPDLDKGLYDGAAYLAGYVVETALKARICKVLGIDDYPSTGPLKPTYAVHDLGQLVLLAGLKLRLGLAAAPLLANWSIAQPWTPERRYTAPGTQGEQDSLDVLSAIRDPKDGILRWIAKFW